MSSVDTVDLSQIYFEDEEYLVFVFEDRQPKKLSVIVSNDLIFNEDELILESQQTWLDSGLVKLNISSRTLFYKNTRIHKVRWFEVVNGVARVLAPKHKSTKEYLVSLFTLGIGGCCLLNRKNKLISKLSKELSDYNKAIVEFKGLVSKSKDIEIQEGATKELQDLKQQLNIEDTSPLISLSREWGSLEQIKAELDGIKSLKGRDNIGISRRLIEEYKSMYLVEERLHRYREMDEEVKSYRDNLSIYEAEEVKRLKNNYGDLNRIQQLLSSAEESSALRREIERLQLRDDQWRELAQGKELEYMLRSKANKDTENPLEEGDKLESKISEYLLDFRNRNSDNFVYESEERSSRSDRRNLNRMDFFLRYTNKHNQYFYVVVECKSTKQWEELEAFGYENTNEEEQLRKGVEQVCKYYDDKGANLGIVVTNAAIFDLREKGIMHVPFKYIPHEYRNKHMDLCIVHESRFLTLLEIIGFINKSYNPITRLSQESNENICSSFWAREFIECANRFKDEHDKFEHLSNRVQDSYDAARKAQNYINHLRTHRNQTRDYLLDITTRIDYHTNKQQPSLEVSTEAEVVKEEEDN